MKILFGTTNPSKLSWYNDLFKEFGLEIIGLNDAGIDEIEIAENGATPEENALIKAKEYYNLAKMPTLAIDYGLYIEKFSNDKQPGMQVRRVGGKRLSDQEMTEYYKNELNEIGGESSGQWITGMALIFGEDQVFSQSFASDTFFTSQECLIKTEGEPLNSLQYIKDLGKYKSEMTNTEKAKLVLKQNEKIKNFVNECVEKTKDIIFYQNLPKKRMACGVIFFNNKEEILIVKPSYKDHWSIPGGVIDLNESPRQAAIREIKEEISLNIDKIDLLSIDYYRNANSFKGEAIHFTFFGKKLDENLIKQIQVDGQEIVEFQFIAMEKALTLVSKEMSKRIVMAMKAIENGRILYLEEGEMA